VRKIIPLKKKQAKSEQKNGSKSEYRKLYMLLLFVSSVFNNFYLFTGLEQDIT
jgi:hypothetical protein